MGRGPFIAVVAVAVLAGLLGVGAPAGAEEPAAYVPPEDPAVQARLEAWQDLKLGLFMHWGPYSLWGAVESWSICNEEWIHRHHGRKDNYEHYKEDYHRLYERFDPVDFDPTRWVHAARAAGMKYVVFTTKHHDGFCNWDTKTTDYRITSPKCPFHARSRADVTRAIFDAFRADGFLIGAYFSKPDWSSTDYWWPYYATPDRHVNYDPAKHPERWQRFKDYTLRQIEELMTGYGRVDILWFDGAWVRPIDNMPEEYESWGRKKDWNQDVDMGRIVEMARSHQPGLVVVDRWVSGPWENYLTPENRVPEEPILVPWESCVPMAPGWSYNENHEYKPVRALVHLLVDVVAKGGNLLLNIGPSPKGDWAPEAYERLEGLGAWMKVNGEAIYGTRPVAPYTEGNLRLTRKKDSSATYAIYLPAGEETELPATITLESIRPQPNSEIRVLGVEEPLPWSFDGERTVIQIPASVRENPPCKHAWTLHLPR